MKSSSSVWNVESVVLKELQVLQVSAQLTYTFANYLKTDKAASQPLLWLEGFAADFGAYLACMAHSI